MPEYKKRPKLKYWEESVLPDNQSLTIFIQSKRAVQNYDAGVVDVLVKAPNGQQYEYSIWISKVTEYATTAGVLWNQFNSIPDGEWATLTKEVSTKYDGTKKKRFIVAAAQVPAGQPAPAQPSVAPVAPVAAPAVAQAQPVEQYAQPFPNTGKPLPQTIKPTQSAPVAVALETTVSDAVDILGGQEMTSVAPAPAAVEEVSEEQAMVALIATVQAVTGPQGFLPLREALTGLQGTPQNVLAVHEAVVNKMFQLIDEAIQRAQPNQ